MVTAVPFWVKTDAIDRQNGVLGKLPSGSGLFSAMPGLSTMFVRSMVASELRGRGRPQKVFGVATHLKRYVSEYLGTSTVGVGPRRPGRHEALSCLRPSYLGNERPASAAFKHNPIVK